MKIIAISLLIMFSLCPVCYASQSIIVETEGYACMSDATSRKQTEQNALLQAKRNAVNTVGAYLTSETIVKDSKSVEDIVKAYGNARVKIVEEVFRKWSIDASTGDCFKTKIKAEVIPDSASMTGIAGKEDALGLLKVEIWTDKKQYKECDKIKVFLKGNKPFYARVIYRDASGKLIQILPNRYRSDNYFQGNVVYEIPSGPDEFVLALTPPFGVEGVTVYASTSEVGGINMEDDEKLYKVLTKEKDLSIKARGIKIKEKSGKPAAAEFSEDRTTLLTTGACLSSAVIPRQIDAEMVVQLGHSSVINEVTVSADNQYFLTGSADSTIKLWRSADGLLIRTLQGHSNEVLAVAVSPEGKTIASASYDKTVRLWDLSTGSLRHTLQAHTEVSSRISIAFSPDGKYLASYAPNNDDLKVWRVSDGTLVKEFPRSGHAYPKTNIVFSPDGTLLAGISSFGIKRVSDGASILSVNMSGFQKAAFTSDNRYLICVSPFKAVILRITDGKIIKTIGADDDPSYHDGMELYAAISLNGNHVALLKKFEKHRETHGIRQVEIFHVPDGKSVGTTYKIYSIYSISPDGRYIAASSATESGIGLFSVSDDKFIAMALVTGSPNSSVINVALNSDGSVLASASTYKRSIWSLSNGSMLRSKFAESAPGVLQDEVNPATLQKPSGISGQLYNGSIKLWEFSDNTLRKTFYFAHHKDYAFSPNGKLLASSRYGDPIKISRVSDGTVLHTLPVQGENQKIVFSPDGRYLASIRGYGGSLVLWDVAEGTRTPIIKNKLSGIWDVAFSRNGKFFAASGAKSIDLWTIPGGRLLKTIAASSNDAKSIDISGDGKYIAGIGDNAIKLWRIADGSVLRIYDQIYTPYYNLANRRTILFSRDGKHLILGDGFIRIINVDTGNSCSLLEKDGEWLLFTSDGYFDASRNGGKLVAMVKGLDAWAVDQFALSNNRPDIILERMGLSGPETIEHYRRMYMKRLRKAGLTESQLSKELHVPVSTIVQAKQDGKFIALTLKLSDSKYNLKKYNIFVNDVPLFGSSGRDISGATFTAAERIELSGGRNRIEVSTINEKGAESYRALYFADYKKQGKGDLYFIGFGISQYKNRNLDLQYAAKDARDLAELFRRLKGNTFKDVFIKTLLDDQVTAENIKASKVFLKNAKVDDTVVLFIAGHGVHDGDKEATYYYLMHNSDTRSLAASALNYEHIEELLQGIAPRNKLFLMDTCESGEIEDGVQKQYYKLADARGIRARAIRSVSLQPKTGEQTAMTRVAPRDYLLQKDRFIYYDLSRREGVIVFSSSHAGELSYESDKIQNGFFTHEIINALTHSDVDKDHDGIVSTDELRTYVIQAVAHQTGGMQHPTVDRDNAYQVFGFPLIQLSKSAP